MKNMTLKDFEQVEAAIEERCELLDNKNYPGLVQHSRERLARDPEDGPAVEALAEAFLLNNQAQDSIDMLTPYYMKDQEHPLYVDAILDALFALGKTVQDFPWKSEPLILELTKDVLDKYYKYLKPKRNPRSVIDLFFTHIADGYIHFTGEDLLQAFIADDRFFVTCDNPYESGISVVRKQRA